MSLCINPHCPQSENSAQTLFCRGCGSELLLAGKYRVTKLMSSKGGCGDTYEITERSIPKVLKVFKTNNAQAIELLDQEFRAFNSLTGAGIKGIPQAEDLFLYSPRNSQQQLNCLVMERIYGMDLEEYLKVMNRPIDEKTAVGWLWQLTQVLEELHQRGILHRDIKPSNIILQPDGQLILIDFGAVKTAATPILEPEIQIYTPGYTAPEQQQLGAASTQSDFFALGRTFVYLLTGKNPTNIYNSYRDLFIWRDKSINTSTSFLDLIDRLMHKDPHQRPDNTATIFREIAALTPVNTRQVVTYALPPGMTNVGVAPARIESPQVPALTVIAAAQNRSNQIVAVLSKNWVPAVGLSILAAWMFWPKSPNAVIANNKMGESFTEIKDVPRGVFKYGGSTTWATTRQLQSSIDAGIKGVFPKYDIVYTDSSSANLKSRWHMRSSTWLKYWHLLAHRWRSRFCPVFGSSR
jgi:serine/threonine protein kinase